MRKQLLEGLAALLRARPDLRAGLLIVATLSRIWSYSNEQLMEHYVHQAQLRPPAGLLSRRNDATAKQIIQVIDLTWPRHQPFGLFISEMGIDMDIELANVADDDLIAALIRYGSENPASALQLADIARQRGDTSDQDS